VQGQKLEPALESVWYPIIEIECWSANRGNALRTEASDEGAVG